MNLPRRKVFTAGVAGLVSIGLVTGGVAALRGEAVMPGITVGGIPVAGLEPAALVARLRPAARVIEQRPVLLTVGERSWSRRPVDLGITVDLQGTAANALATGRRNPFDWTAQAIGGREVGLGWVPRMDRHRFGRALADLADAVRLEASSGEVHLEGAEVTVKAPADGVALIRSVARETIPALILGPVQRMELPVTVTPPPIGADQVLRVEAQARAILTGPVEFALSGRTISLSPEKVAAALVVRAIADPEDPDAQQLVLQVDPERLRDQIVALAPWAEDQPKDASFSVEGTRVSVIASRDGSRIDASLAAEAVSRLRGDGERSAIPLSVVPAPPAFTTEEARALSIVEKISIFTTTFDPANTPRVSNIDLMADAIDGTVVRPGETFSLNDATGPRTPERGYREAQIIVDGELVPGIGGGVCQVGTTLFNAVFLSGVEVLERTNHSLHISKYPIGRDATVNYGYQDLKFRNDTPHGILMKTSVTSKALTVSFFSTSVGRTVEVQTSPRRNPKEPPVKYVDDPTLPAGQEVVVEQGSAGFDITVIRTVREGDSVIRTDTFVSKYRPWKRIIRRGTGPAPSPSPSESPV